MTKVKVNKEVGKALDLWFERETNTKEGLLENQYISLNDNIPWRGVYKPFNSLTLLDVANIVSCDYEVEKQWYESKSSLELKGDVDTVILESNQINWEESKSEKTPLLISMVGYSQHTFTGLTLEQMKQLNNYLKEKIDYLSK